MKINWFWVFLFVLTGFMIFENIGVALIYGIAFGLIFGGIFSK